MKITAPRGTKDILPYESYQWQYIEQCMRNMCALYGLLEVRTPVFEHTELFMRGVGDTTDIVQKEMYTFLDKGERSITLKPEGTAGVVRCFVENKLYSDVLPLKVYYLNAPIFRYEKPQAGRLREHHQFGVEVFGAKNASCDAEMIELAWRLLTGFGLQNIQLHINSIGCAECRPLYNEKLKQYLQSNQQSLCETCHDRMSRNPLRVLDCKTPACQQIVKNAPVITNHLCDDCQTHFSMLQEYFNLLNIPFVVDPFIVRGLDYYTRTVFEFIYENQGTALTVCAGGRYDGLVAQCDGPDTPAVGFGMGLERLLLVMENQGITIPKLNLADVIICSIGEKAEEFAFTLTSKLRAQGISADCDHVGRSLKAQFKYADKIGAPYVLVLGDDELEKGVIKLRDMDKSNEETVSLELIVEKIKSKLKG